MANKEIRKETDWLGREKDVIYEDGKKVGETWHETTIFGTPKDVTYNTQGEKVSETRHETTLFGTPKDVTYDKHGDEISETRHEETLLGNKIDVIYEKREKIGKLRREDTLLGTKRKVLDEVPGHDVDLTRRVSRKEPPISGLDSGWGERSYTTRDKDAYNYPFTNKSYAQRTGIIEGGANVKDAFPFKFIFGLILFIGLLGIGKDLKEHSSHNKQIVRETSFSREEVRRDERLPPYLIDYSLSPDKSQIAFSQQVIDNCYNYIEGIFNSPIVDVTRKKRFRVFLNDLNDITNNGKRISLLDKADWKTKDAISWEDLVAPLFSPDGKKIAFAVTREDHPSSVYIVDSNGKNFKRVSKWSDTVVFGWVSDKQLFVWGHYYTNANFFNPLNYNGGESSLVDIINYTSPEPVGLDFRPHEKQIYVPSVELRVKYVSASITNSMIVREYIITKKK